MNVKFFGKGLGWSKLVREPKSVQILQKVFDCLDSLTLSPFYSLFGKCGSNLQMCARHQQIVFFSSNEDETHSIKIYLAHYVCYRLARRGIQLKTSCDHCIHALVMND